MSSGTAQPPSIRVHTTFVPPSDVSLPALAVQTTQLVDSYMLWVGTTEQPPEEVHKAPSSGFLSKDWACAMPARDSNANIPPAATSLLRSSSSDVALSMAQRLGDIQFYIEALQKADILSIDVPPSFLSMGQGAKLIFAVEKAVVDTLKAMEHQTPT